MVDEPPRGRVTEVLQSLREGAEGAGEELLRLVYEELRRLAGAQMRDQPAGHTLQPTALVHEAFLRLLGGDAASWNDRRHFLAAAGRAMRSVLVDFARSRGAQKRGGEGRRIPLDDDVARWEDPAEEVLAVHDALARLEAIDPRQSRLVELRFFAGLEFEEAARVLGVSRATVFRLWDAARAWLYREMAS